jgi:hypothetical protein
MNYLGCRHCKHYTRDGKCPAFPRRIPLVVAGGMREHTVIFEGQVGDYVYEPRDERRQSKRD